MRPSLVQLVTDFLGLDRSTVEEMAQKAPITYRHYQIRKKRGGFRTIYHPSKETKSLQYALMHLLGKVLEPDSSAMAFRRGFESPLRKNAEAHAQFPYTLRIDFKDFFPSITPDDLFAAMEGPNNPAKMQLSFDERAFLKQVFFVRQKDGNLGLPIGAPASPLLSNAVMRSLDLAIKDYATRHDFVYTRYADDLVFSTATKGVSRDFLTGLRAVIANSEHPKPTINEPKTLFMSRNARRVVTGLTINPDGTLSIGRKPKRYLRRLLNHFRYRRLDDHEKHSLQGHLAFILDVEPGLYNRLCQKYGAGLVLDALKQRGDKQA
jgi:hypothetical protein